MMECIQIRIGSFPSAFDANCKKKLRLIFIILMVGAGAVCSGESPEKKESLE